MEYKMIMYNNISLPCPRLARWAFGVQVFNEEQFVLHLTPRPRFGSRLVGSCIRLRDPRASFRSHSLTPLSQIGPRRCSAQLRRRGTVS